MWLEKMGFNLRTGGLSADQFQSEYMIQLFEAQGWEVSNISLDRTPDPYTGCQSILLENRIDMLDNALLQDELVHLQRDPLSGKIIIPQGATKDVSDSFAGSLWNATVKNPAIMLAGKALSSVVAGANRRRGAVPGTSVIAKVNGPRKSAEAEKLPSMFPGLYNK